MGSLLTNIWETLNQKGGLLRVRAVLAILFTVGGTIYILDNLAMPPGEFNTMWSITVAYYFATRGAEGDRS